MILFLYYYLHACVALGVSPLPVAMLPYGIPVWARVCNSCDVRRVEVHPDLVSYNNARFTKIVAEHEACHIALGHDRAWAFNPFTSVEEAEAAARTCTEENFWTSREVESALSAEATRWDEGRRGH